MFSKNTEMSNFLNVRPVGAELFYAHRQTDMTKLFVVFRYFANAYKNRYHLIINGYKLVIIDKAT